MPDEYSKFLAKLKLTEADVYPMLGDRQRLRRPDVRSLILQYLLAVLLSGDPEQLAEAGRLVEATSAGANANLLIRRLDNLLRGHLAKLGMQMPDGVLATGVYPLPAFRAMTVPRQNGVLLLLATGSMEFLEYAVSLTLMPEPPSQTEKIKLFVKAVRQFVTPEMHLPLPVELDGPSWNSMRECIYHGTTWAEWFLLCHEYAHHALGHLKNSHAERYTDIYGDFEVVQFSHIQEYEADLWAMSQLLCVVAAGAPPLPTDKGVAFAIAAPIYYLGILETMDKARGIASEKYPSAAARILNLEIFINDCGFKERKQLYLYATIMELLDGVSREIASSDLMAAVLPDRQLARELAQVIVRMRPVLPGFKTSKEQKAD